MPPINKFLVTPLHSCVCVFLQLVSALRDSGWNCTYHLVKSSSIVTVRPHEVRLECCTRHLATQCESGLLVQPIRYLQALPRRQTFLHLLNNCLVALQCRRCNQRHDLVLAAISAFLTEVLDGDYTIVSNLAGADTYTLPPTLTPTDLRPDIVILSEVKQQCDHH